MALEQPIMIYTGNGNSYGVQWVHFRDKRRSFPENLGQLNSSSMQHVIRRLKKSFAAFFRRLKAGENPGPQCERSIVQLFILINNFMHVITSSKHIKMCCGTNRVMVLLIVC